MEECATPLGDQGGTHQFLVAMGYPACGNVVLGVFVERLCIRTVLACDRGKVGCPGCNGNNTVDGLCTLLGICIVFAAVCKVEIVSGGGRKEKERNEWQPKKAHLGQVEGVECWTDGDA